MEQHPIILFDGICNYCNYMVNFVIRNDRKKKFRFAPLQSDAGIRLRDRYGVSPTTDSVVLLENGRAYTLSTAALRISRYLNWPARAISGLLIVPAFIRDGVYKWMARNRYRWFGKKDACMVPGPGVRDRFIT